eukprot:gene7594-10247_t
MIHGRKRAVRHEDLETEIAQHPEGLRRSDLVDQVRADEELRLAVGQLADGVSVPDFFVVCAEARDQVGEVGDDEGGAVGEVRAAGGGGVAQVGERKIGVSGEEVGPGGGVGEGGGDRGGGEEEEVRCG